VKFDRFRLVSRWSIDAPEDRVYAALLDIGALSKWWSGLSSTPLGSSTDVIGREAIIEVRGLAPFRLRVRVRIESVERNREIRVTASGDLEGFGAWRLRPTARGTEARFEWDVRLRHARLRRVALVLRPLLMLSHAVAMRRGACGLQKLLEERSAMSEMSGRLRASSGR
jgi:uncharacterized protein YndB with AHSA1/START domain